MTLDSECLPRSVVLEAASGYWFDRFGVDVTLASISSPSPLSDQEAQSLLDNSQKFNAEYEPKLVWATESKVEVRGTNKQLITGAKVGKYIRRELLDHQVEIVNYGFLDTVSIEQRSKATDWRCAAAKGRQVESFKKFHEEHLSPIDVVRCEHELVGGGLEFIESLKRSPAVRAGRAHVYDDNAYMIFTNGDSTVSGVRLKGYSDRHTDLGQRYEHLPSCEVLDAVSYLEKLVLAENVITVLPHTFRSQQSRVKRLLSLFRDDLPIVNVFTGSGQNGKLIDSIKPWQESVRPLAALLRQKLV